MKHTDSFSCKKSNLFAAVGGRWGVEDQIMNECILCRGRVLRVEHTACAVFRGGRLEDICCEHDQVVNHILAFLLFFPLSVKYKCSGKLIVAF